MMMANPKTLMLVLVVLVTAVALAAASEVDTEEMMIRICGNDLGDALEEVCVKKSLDYLLKHGTPIYDKEIHKHKHQHNDQHQRDHDHHDHGHDHDHGHNHHNIHNVKNEESILEMCCHKPCLVKDFLAFCKGL